MTIEINENTTFDEALKLRGSEIQVYRLGEQCVDWPPFVFTRVGKDTDGDLRLSAEDDEGVIIYGGWTARVLRRPETPRERVERLRAELEAAEKDLASEGLPEGFRWDSGSFVDTPWGPINTWGAPAIVSDHMFMGYNFHDKEDVFFKTTSGSVTINTAVLFAWVDKVRENGEDDRA